MRRNSIILILCIAVMVALAGMAEDTSLPERFVRCTFTPIPKEYRVLATFDALAVGKDGLVYMGTSTYGTPALLLCYNPSSRSIMPMCDVSSPCFENAVPDLVHSGKIHTPLRIASDGKIYFGSHLADDRCMTGENPHRYGGGHFMRYDPATGKAEDLGVAHWPESVMRVELDEKRGLLYSMTWPDGHFIVKDLKTGAITNKGKAAHSGYAMPLLMSDGRTYWTSRPGHLCRYDPDDDTIREVCDIPAFPNGKQPNVWSQFFDIQKTTADRSEIWGVMVNNADDRFLFRFRCPARRDGKCTWDYIEPLPKDIGGTVVFAPDGGIYLYTYLSKRLSYFDRETNKFYDLGIPRDDQRHTSLVIYTAVFASDGTLYLGGVMDIPEEKVKETGYAKGVLGFYRILPEDLTAAIKEVRK